MLCSVFHEEPCHKYSYSTPFLFVLWQGWGKLQPSASFHLNTIHSCRTLSLQKITMSYYQQSSSTCCHPTAKWKTLPSLPSMPGVIYCPARCVQYGKLYCHRWQGSSHDSGPDWRGEPTFLGKPYQILYSSNNTGEIHEARDFGHGKYLTSPFFFTWKCSMVLSTFPPEHLGRCHQNFTRKQNYNRKEISATLSGPQGRYFLGLVDRKMTAFKHLCADEKWESVSIVQTYCSQIK